MSQGKDIFDALMSHKDAIQRVHSDMAEMIKVIAERFQTQDKVIIEQNKKIRELENQMADLILTGKNNV